MNLLNEEIAGLHTGVCTIKEVCAHFRVGRTTAYKWLAEQKLEGLKVGGKRMISLASVQRLAAASIDMPQKL